MAGIVRVQLNGNVVATPEIRFTPGGAAVANFRVACTERTFDRQTNTWKDGDTTFLTVIGWRALAENIAETLKKGTAVIVTGVLRQRTYETREGEKRTVYEVQEPIVGPDLQLQSAVVTRNNADPTAASRSARPTEPAEPTLPAQPAQPTPATPPAGGAGGFSPLDEPPF